MQSLNWKLAALKRFLARSAERSLPLFDTLKDITKENKDEYRWTEDAEKAFQEMKKVIIELPLLTTPRKEEMLYVYLAAVEKAVSAVLLTERNGKQCPIHYVSKTLNEAKRNYILNKAQASGKLAKYSIELGTYNIAYDPRNAIKGQVLADFLSEAPVGVSPEEFFRLPTQNQSKDAAGKWTLFTDGESNRLHLAAKMKLQTIYVKVDSKLVASHINGNYVASITSMIKYLATAKGCIAGFKSFAIKNFPRNLNQKADILSKLATHAFDHLTKEVLVEVLSERPTDQREVNAILEEENDNWMTPIIWFLAEGVWPEDKDERRALRMKINQYVLEEGILFKKGMHMGARSMVAKAIRQGYYWPTMHRDARNMIQKCDSCQVHAPVPKRPKILMTLIMAPWPFYQRGMDILGPLPQSAGKVKFVILAIDYFNKWLEAKPLARITSKEVKKFVWDNIVCPDEHGGGSPTGKHAGGKGKQKSDGGNKGKAGKGNGRMGRRATQRTLGPSNRNATHRTMRFRENENEEELRLNMDLLQERREAAAVREARYKTKIEQYYNHNVRATSFKPDEYVFRRNEASRVEDQGNLGPTWEGPLSHPA
ncbi:reverse transcriptase domain-containing protein [Tanacetum coccineum]